MGFLQGYHLGEKLMKALGLDGPIQRIVIDCPADDVVRVFIQRPLDQAEVPALLDALDEATRGDTPVFVMADSIQVDEKGRVTATPKTPSIPS